MSYDFFISFSLEKNIYIIICICFSIIFMFLELEFNLNYFLKNSNTGTGGSSSGGGGDKKPSGDDEPGPNEETILAGMLSFVDENKKVIIGVVVGTLVLVGGYFLLNHFDIVPSISKIFSSTVKEIPDPIPTNETVENILPTTTMEVISPIAEEPISEVVESILPTTVEVISPIAEEPISEVVESILPTTMEVIPPIAEEIVATATNSILNEALGIERFQTEPIPNYFSNLAITEENFTVGLFGFNTYQEYKEAVLNNFLTLYENINRNIVTTQLLTPKGFTQNGVLHLYVEAMREFPQNVALEITDIQKEIVKQTFDEEKFLIEHDGLIPIFQLFMLLLQQQITGIPANID